MIKKISKFKEFGIFHDFSWKTELPEFKKFNLVYGWNRSGKTTISRVFASCEKKCVYDKEKFKQYPENGEFEIITSDDAKIKNTDVTRNILLTKVFNKDFIDDNISFDPSNSCNPIVYVSEEDIESKKRLEKLIADNVTLNKNYEDAKKNKETKEEVKNNFLIGLGREIANILFDKAYNKTKAENKIKSFGIDNFSDKILPDEDKKKYEAISKSEEGKIQPLFQEYRFSFVFKEDPISDFKKLFETIQTLIGKKVVSETLERLKNDQELNIWVKQGFDLHKAKKETEKCLFCQKPLDRNFLSSLSKHFSKEYEALQSLIVKLKAEIIKIKKDKIAFKNEELYPDLHQTYEVQVKALNDTIEKLNDWIDKAIVKLNEKYNNPLIAISNPEKPEDFLITYNKFIGELNNVVSSHNNKVGNHLTEVKNAREKLELHTIAVALTEQDFNKFESELQEAETKEKVVFDVLNKNDVDISELEKQTSNIGKAIIEINKHLKDFFGKEEITLELDESKKGYIIRRDGQPAKNLSEGEKTAIAFSYFLVKVKEKEFKIKECIIFIDDPISSFDSNFIYHSFSLINTYFKEVDQLFISTHNFQLFNLVKEWFNTKNSAIKRDNEKLKAKGMAEKPIPCEFYMIENFIDSDIRKAKLVILDNTLRQYKSEYHFLFSLLNKFKNKDLNYADFYTIGNVARRFFDIFADFKIPDLRNQKQKLEAIVLELNKNKIDNERIGDSESNKAYKLVNEFSHNSDPTSAIEHKDKLEIKEAIKILLKIIKESDPKHYEILEKNITDL